MKAPSGAASSSFSINSGGTGSFLKRRIDLLVLIASSTSTPTSHASRIFPEDVGYSLSCHLTSVGPKPWYFYLTIYPSEMAYFLLLFHHHCHTLAAADTHRDESLFPLLVLHFMHRSDQHSGPGSADRMPQGDAAAIGIGVIQT